MKSKLTALAIAVVLGTGVAIGASQDAAQTVYGWQLMTPQEQVEHRNKMLSLPFAERQAYRNEHHEEMKQRAEAQGLRLPDQPLFVGRMHRRGAGAFGPGYGFPGSGGRWCQR